MKVEDYVNGIDKKRLSSLWYVLAVSCKSLWKSKIGKMIEVRSAGLLNVGPYFGLKSDKEEEFLLQDLKRCGIFEMIERIQYGDYESNVYRIIKGSNFDKFADLLWLRLINEFGKGKIPHGSLSELRGAVSFHDQTIIECGITLYYGKGPWCKYGKAKKWSLKGKNSKKYKNFIFCLLSHSGKKYSYKEMWEVLFPEEEYKYKTTCNDRVYQCVRRVQRRLKMTGKTAVNKRVIFQKNSKIWLEC